MFAPYCCARCILVAASMFSDQKFFLDVKDHSKLGQLEATICQLGGTVEKFLSKDITCVVTNRVRTESVSLQKDVSAPTSAHNQSFRPCAGGSRFISRGQALLMHSNSLKDTSFCEPVAFAEMWGIKIVTLDNILQAIDRQLHAFSPSTPSSPATKRPVKPHHVMNKTRFVGAFIKVEDMESNFRPFFSQYSTFPRLDLEGDLSSGIFKCADSIRPPVAARKNVSTPTASTRKQKVSKRGYCECCDTMYDDLSQHLTSKDHQRFAENAENFASLDKLIDEICSSDGIGTSFSVNNFSTQDVADKTKSAVYAEEIWLNSCNDPSTAAVESASHHSGGFGQNQFSGRLGKPEESDKVSNSVENRRESNDILGEEKAEVYCKSPLQLSSGVNRHSLNSENHQADDEDKVNNMSLSPTLEVHCDADITLSTSVTVASSVDSHKTTEALSNVKSCSILVDGNTTNSDDMPQFISSDCVVNLLELLSSENSVDSICHVEDAGPHAEVTSEKPTSVTLLQSLESPHVAAVCTSSSGTVCDEMLPCTPKDCQPATTASVSTEHSFPLTLMENDLLDRHGSAAIMEQCHAVDDKLTTNCELISNTLMLPTVSDVLIVPPTDAAVPNYSSIMNDEMNYDDTRSSCDVTVSCDVAVLRSSSYVHQPTTCTVPIYTTCDVNNSAVFTDCVSLPVQNNMAADSLALHCASDIAEPDSQQNFSSAPVASDIIADCIDLHDKLLTMGYASDVAQHGQQQNCSLSCGSYPCLADYAAAATADNNLCLPMTFSPPSCLSEVSGPPVDCEDASLRTPVHSPSHLLDSPATYSSFSAYVSTEAASFYQSSPASCFNYFAESADISDSLHSSVPCTQRNVEGNAVSNKQANACFAQDKQDLQINSPSYRAFDTQLAYDVTRKCTSLYGAEGCHKSSAADTAWLGTRLVENVSCCEKPSLSALDSVMSLCSALLRHSEVNSVIAESCDSAEPVRADTDTGSDSACTMVYNYDGSALSVLQHASDTCSPGKNKTTVDCGELFDPNANSRWKVISCDDCRMRLVRTEAVFPAEFDQNDTTVENRSCVLRPELHCVSERLAKAGTGNRNDSTSTVVSSCDRVTSSVGVHASDIPPDESKPETDVDHSTTSANCTWEVISFADCRMKLVRNKTVFPALCVQTVSSSDSSHCNAKELFLLNVADSILTC